MSTTNSNDASTALAVLQTAQRHHVSMTAMAGQKANLLLTALLGRLHLS